MMLIGSQEIKYETLYKGDCLDVLPDFPDESVDLVYIDPPFFTQRFHRYRDTDVGFDDRFESIESYIDFMTLRLIELHRVLKKTGSIYIHCDNTASHYLKVACDGIFGYRNFKNEIIWKRSVGSSSTTGSPRNYATKTDSILFYTKSGKHVFNAEFIPPNAKNYTRVEKDGRKFQNKEMSQPTDRRFLFDDIKIPANRPTLKYIYKGVEPPPKGWRWKRETMERKDAEGYLDFYVGKDGKKKIRQKIYLDESRGSVLSNYWGDINCINSAAKERMGYPTQKPIALLERIIKCSTNEGDVVLDAFCGSGTTLHAAHNLNRRWVGIDANQQAISISAKRLKNAGAKVKKERKTK